MTTVSRIDPIFVDVEESSRRLAEIRRRIEEGRLQAGTNLGIRLTLETGEIYEAEGEMITPGMRVSQTTGTLVSQYPDIAPTTIRVSASYPGASASTVENSVTRVIEDAMMGLEGLICMTDRSSRVRPRSSLSSMTASIPPKPRPRCSRASPRWNAVCHRRCNRRA